jgi:predicted ribosome quality control (RQC) complex YloA/Tae2 family protein
MVGRGARENHELTFKVARPEDFWLHARDVPGAHVILRDPERRAAADDLREAAEVAAFFSGARENAQVEVHVARRKHVRPAGGGAGRVRVSHSDTERVAPRDPEGRLRKR